MPETKEEKNFCQLSLSEFEGLGEIYREKCLGKIKGKVLKTELTTDKYDKSNESCMKIRINKGGKGGEGREESKKYLVYYGLENPGGKNRRPQEGKTYGFGLHEREKKTNEGFKKHQRNGQGTHDGQLI